MGSSWRLSRPGDNAWLPRPLLPLPSLSHQRRTLSPPSLAPEGPTTSRSRPRTSSSTLPGSKPPQHTKKCHPFKLTIITLKEHYKPSYLKLPSTWSLKICSITNTHFGHQI